jgi:UDP-GlcNAc:undecaprenyl-phosphate GlcNAc-1-phosphate transferase
MQRPLFFGPIAGYLPTMTEFLLVALIAFASGAVLTPLMRLVSQRAGLVDHPDGRRKLHAQPIALGGGVAVFVATFLSLTCAVFVFPSVNAVVDKATDSAGRQNSLSFLVGLFVSSLLIVGIGLLDDRFNLRGRQKLLGQIFAVSILLSSGLVVENIQIFGWNHQLGLLAYPFTMFWLLGAINALNLIDGLDGLASSVGAILSLAIVGMAIITGHDLDAIVALALCGALLAFLIYNLPPASIYLGDAGSMLIGLLLGALAMRSSFKAPATVALMAPTVIWAIPILDVGMAILRRKLTGRSIYETDRGHLHHCLLRSGFSGQMTLLSIGVFCAITAIGALISVVFQDEWLALISAVAVFGTLVVSRLFGFAECKLLGNRLKSIVTSFIPASNRKSGMLASPAPVHARLTGTRDWEELWETLTEYAERFDLSSVQLNVNLPALNEEYHVNWNRRDRGPEREQWTTDIPLITGGTTIGRLRISGRSSEGSICTWMGDLIAGLKPFEMQVSAILSDQMQLRHFQRVGQEPDSSDAPAMVFEANSG